MKTLAYMTFSGHYLKFFKCNHTLHFFVFRHINFDAMLQLNRFTSQIRPIILRKSEQKLLLIISDSKVRHSCAFVTNHLTHSWLLY